VLSDVDHKDRLIPAHLRMCVVMLAALLFSLFTSAAHAHNDSHDDVLTACDTCLSAYSDEDDTLDSCGDEPDRLDPPVYILPSSLSMPQDIDAPGFDRALVLRTIYIDVGQRPNAARAPPL
jgi:hypothetical protein